MDKSKIKHKLLSFLGVVALSFSSLGFVGWTNDIDKSYLTNSTSYSLEPNEIEITSIQDLDLGNFDQEVDFTRLSELETPEGQIIQYYICCKFTLRDAFGNSIKMSVGYDNLSDRNIVLYQLDDDGYLVNTDFTGWDLNWVQKGITYQLSGAKAWASPSSIGSIGNYASLTCSEAVSKFNSIKYFNFSWKDIGSREVQCVNGSYQTVTELFPNTDYSFYTYEYDIAPSYFGIQAKLGSQLYTFTSNGSNTATLNALTYTNTFYYSPLPYTTSNITYDSTILSSVTESGVKNSILDNLAGSNNYLNPTWETFTTTSGSLPLTNYPSSASGTYKVTYTSNDSNLTTYHYQGTWTANLIINYTTSNIPSFTVSGNQDYTQSDLITYINNYLYSFNTNEISTTVNVTSGSLPFAIDSNGSASGTYQSLFQPAGTGSNVQAYQGSWSVTQNEYVPPLPSTTLNIPTDYTGLNFNTQSISYEVSNANLLYNVKQYFIDNEVDIDLNSLDITVLGNSKLNKFFLNTNGTYLAYNSDHTGELTGTWSASLKFNPYANITVSLPSDLDLSEVNLNNVSVLEAIADYYTTAVYVFDSNNKEYVRYFPSVQYTYSFTPNLNYGTYTYKLVLSMVDPTYGAIYSESNSFELTLAYPDVDPEVTGSVISLALTILNAPFSLLQNAFNFELFGVNISALIFGLMTVAIIAFVFKLIRRAN